MGAEPAEYNPVSTVPFRGNNVSDYLIVLTTMPDRAQAEALAGRLLEQKLAACINLLPPMTSMYTWQGRVEKEDEHLMLIKTRTSRYEDLAVTVREHHPYEVPELIAVDIVAGLPEYLDWVGESTGQQE